MMLQITCMLLHGIFINNCFISVLLFFVFYKYSIYLFDIAIINVLCDWLHIPIILAKAIGIIEIAHFCLNYSVYPLMTPDELSFFQLILNRFNFFLFVILWFSILNT